MEQEHLLYQTNMAHYALLDQDNIVINIIVGNDETDEIDWEKIYEDNTGLKCKRTSYNTFGGEHRQGGIPFRKNYASYGHSYDENRDAFIPPKPYESWILDEETCLWIPPIPDPSVEGDYYFWNEETVSWERIPDDVVAEYMRNLEEMRRQNP